MNNLRMRKKCIVVDKKSRIFPIGGAKEHLMHPTFYCFNISWLRIVSKRHQWLAIFNQPDFVALVDDSKTNRWENHRAKKKRNKRKTHCHEASLYEGCEHVWPNGNHDVPEVQRWDGAAVGLVTLDESLSRVFQLHLLQRGEVRRKEGRQGVSAYTKLILLCTYVGQTPLWVAFRN